MSVEIKIYKSKKLLEVIKGSKVVFKTPAHHGGSATPKGTKTITKWVWGAASGRWGPNTWYSWGHELSKFPKVGEEGEISAFGKKWKVRRDSAKLGHVFYDGDWYPLWPKINPYGVTLADLSPGKIELHGTGQDQSGKDVFPTVTHGCVRTANDAIKKIRNLAPKGTKVTFLG